MAFASDDKRVVEGLRDELLAGVEAIVGYSQILCNDAGDRPASMLKDMHDLLSSANGLYALIKEKVDPDSPDLTAPDAADRLRRVRHDIGNRLNQTLGYCQLLLQEENEDHFGTFAKDLVRIQAFLTNCTATLHRYKHAEPVPCVNQDSAPAEAPSAPAERPSIDHSTQEVKPYELAEHATVLVVDDSDVTRNLMARFLKQEGHRVAMAANGRTALEMVAENDYDLILLDFLMPELNGYQVLKRLKADERFRHIPVIMISALDTVADIVPCIEIGADDYLSKPVDFSLLRARTNASLERKRLREREFGQFFTPELARHFVRDPQLIKEGREAEVTVLFCDIRHFSRISELIGPAKTVRWVSQVMDMLSDCVIENRGVLVDYVGDELMAMWGAPLQQLDHADLACQAAIEMLVRMPEINARMQELTKEPTDVGIGLNSGVAQVGNTGSSRKFKYGPLGNTVNLASRVQGATKFLATKLLVTGSTRRKLHGKFAERRLCKARVVNINEPVELYEILPLDQKLPDKSCRLYEAALKHFERRNLRRAAAILGRLLAHEPHDGPALMLMSRVVESLLQQKVFDPVWQLPGK